MGMCKDCGDVVASSELKEGFCKNCLSAEKIEEKNKLSEKNNFKEKANKRPIGVTIVGVLLMISSVIVFIAMVITFSSYGVNGSSLLLFVISLIQVFVSYGLLKGQRNARTIYTVIAILSTVINLATTSQIDGKVLASVFITIVFLGILYMPVSEAFFNKGDNV